MGSRRILVSPAGYDDVGVVLKQLGGEVANFQQLELIDLARLEDLAFLSQFKHLFLNCHQAFSDSSNQRMIASIKQFVELGGVLYASDWASTIIGAAFGNIISFNHRAGAHGIVKARVDDLRLVHLLGKSVPIHFDMGGWDVIQTQYYGEDVYLWDEAGHPIAIGFEAGQGRVIFTSFHHHAQKNDGDEASEAERVLLEWLILIVTQHEQLLQASELLEKYRSFGIGGTVDQIGDEPSVISLQTASKPGLGVFGLFWKHNQHLEVSMRYLRAGEHLAIEKSSKTPPITIVMRNPQREDIIEIRRNVTKEVPDTLLETTSYVFSASVRRDLLDNSSWFALALLRHVRVSIEEAKNNISIREIVTEKFVKKCFENILSGLGYRLDQENKESTQTQYDTIFAHSTDSTTGANIQIKFLVDSETKEQVSERETENPLPMLPEIVPPYNAFDPGTEYIFVSLTVLPKSIVRSTNLEEQLIGSQVKDSNWTIVAIERLFIDFPKNSARLEEYPDKQDLRIVVCKVSE